MNKIWIIARKDISEAFRSRSTYMFTVIMIFLTLSYAATYSRTASEMNSQAAIDAFSRSFVTYLAFILPAMYSIFVCSIFATYSVVVDKAKRNIESLMATPVSIYQIWMGKTLAVALPSFGVGLFISVLAYLVLNFGFVMPHSHFFVFPSVVAIVGALLLIPLLLFAVVSVVIFIQLVIANPRIANIAFTILFVLLLFSMNVVTSLGLSFNFLPLAYGGIILLCALISGILSRFLTKERVLLSSKT